jgi:hypothetical protein
MHFPGMSPLDQFRETEHGQTCPKRVLRVIDCRQLNAHDERNEPKTFGSSRAPPNVASRKRDRGSRVKHPHRDRASGQRLAEVGAKQQTAAEPHQSERERHEEPWSPVPGSPKHKQHQPRGHYCPEQPTDPHVRISEANRVGEAISRRTKTAKTSRIRPTIRKPDRTCSPTVRFFVTTQGFYDLLRETGNRKLET